MLQLVSNNNLTQASQDILAELQKEITLENDFAKKVKKAASLWAAKNNSLATHDAFSELKEKLTEMCVSVEICNYCEQNEANDIEHIYPKSFFPELAFIWSNYLLACKQCNSGYKLDKCFVLDNNDDVVEVKRGIEPVHKTGAFINPRIEDPNKSMILNMQTHRFELFPDLSKKQQNKAQKTLDILQLNHRDTLIEARKSAGIYYYQRMKLLTDLLKAENLLEIENLLTPYDLLDNSLPLDQIKENLKNSFKKHITSFQHPSVWFAIKTIDSKVVPKWKALFDEIPDAFNW